MYKNWVKNDIFFRFPLFYLPVNNIYILNFPASFSAEFPHLQDEMSWYSKRKKKINKSFLIFLYPTFYAYPSIVVT